MASKVLHFGKLSVEKNEKKCKNPKLGQKIIPKTLNFHILVNFNPLVVEQIYLLLY